MRDAWNPNAGLSLSLGGAQFGFGVADVFARIEDPPYANGNGLGGVPNGRPPIQRTNNQASIEGRWSPGGGRLTSVLRFTNMVNIYDNNGHRELQLRERDDQHADAGRRLEVAPQDRHLPERSAELRRLPQPGAGGRPTSSPIRTRCT